MQAGDFNGDGIDELIAGGVDSFIIFKDCKSMGKNNTIYYFETIGDYKKANDMEEVKEIIKESFRNMVKLLQIRKPQLN